MNDHERWVRPSGSAAGDGWDVVVDATGPDWRHTSLRVVALGAGESRSLAADAWEHVVVPLSGSVEVTVVDPAGSRHDAVLTGRPSVFAGATDVAYATRDCELTVTAPDGPAKVAVCGARADSRSAPPLHHLGVSDVPVELRGAGTASREVRNFGVPGVLAADSIIACEVITPAGNWSSYPPHKHDTERDGVEAELEEIYYFEVRPEAGSSSPPDADPVGYQRVYGTADRPIDVLTEVRAGDVVLVPHGWHGPSMAAPGYDLYYLNVMAGPGRNRAWLICDDPAHSWVRDTWAGQSPDPRLPTGGPR